MLGVARADLLDPMADALRRLGLERAAVVHGHGGMDEASLSGESELRLLEAGAVRPEVLDPTALGLKPAPIEALAGGDVERNAAILEAVLQGRGTEAQRDVVALNTALVLWSAGLCDSVAAGLPTALHALEAGSPWQRLEGLRQALPMACLLYTSPSPRDQRGSRMPSSA